MFMTEEKIRKVPPERVHLLLVEPVFKIEGKEYSLLTKHELMNQRVANTAGIDPEDLLTEGNIINRSVEGMVNLITESKEFRLVNYSDARLIFTIIDHFLNTQASIMNQRLRGIEEFMWEDFANLTTLANMMLEYIDIKDRVDLMNAPKEEVRYESIFDMGFGAIFTPEIEVPDSDVPDGKRGYRSPFANVLATRHINRTKRW